jgi:hypothetical protein
MTATDTILELAKVNDEALVHSPEWWRQLVDAVNDLLVNDFNALVQILYRLDVDENKIRASLAGNVGTDAAELIARLLLERQVQKLQYRKSVKTDLPEDEGERW